MSLARGGALYGWGRTCGALEPGSGSRSHHNSAGGGEEGGEVTAWREGLGVGEKWEESGRNWDLEWGGWGEK